MPYGAGVWRAVRDRTRRPISPRHVITAEDNQVGRRGGEQIDGRRYIVGGDHRAVVDVGDEADADPVVRGGESGYGQRRGGDADSMPFEGDAVGAGSSQRTNGRGDDALEGRAPSERHTRLYSSG